jgi:hypothetical protein
VGLIWIDTNWYHLDYEHDYFANYPMFKRQMIGGYLAATGEDWPFWRLASFLV